MAYLPMVQEKEEQVGRAIQIHWSWNGNQIWRWVHITTGSLWVILLADGLFLEGLIFGEDDEAILPTLAFLIAFFGTIISGWAKWPIYPWYKKRKNRKKRAAKEAIAEEE